MKTFFKILNIVVLAALIFTFGYIVGKKFDIAVDESNNLVGITYSDNEHKIRRLMSLIDNQYVEDVDTDSLVDDAIKNILNNLDPHSAYIEKENVSRIEEDIKGEFVGIGVQFRSYNDTLVITRVLEESPNNNRLKAGDKIVGANKESLTGENSNKTSDLLRGEENSTVKVNLVRNKKSQEVKLIRKSIPIKSVVASYMIAPEIGFIKLIRFGEKSASEIKESIIRLKNLGMETLILDLRSNPGGIMQAAEEISDEFLKNKELIVYTKDKEGNQEFKRATSKGNFENNKIYILIDEGSASASEIVAGAVQEWGRGIIVGRRSFGKGLVQKEINLGDGSKLRLTTARYYTPSGRSIQKPYSKGNEEYDDDLVNRYLNGELTNKDSVRVNKDLKFTTPTGKTVYGGGGIVPDVFVPINTERLTTWLYGSGGINLLSNFAFETIEQNNLYTKVSDENSLLKHFESLKVLNQFLQEYKGIQFSESEKHEIEVHLKSLIARQLLGENAYYKFFNQADAGVQKVLDLEKPNLK